MLPWRAEGKETRGSIPGEVSGAAQVIGKAQVPLLSPKGARVSSLLDAVTWSMRSTKSAQHPGLCPLKNCLPATQKGIKGTKRWPRACAWGWTSGKERACKCFINFPLGFCPGWEPINKSRLQRGRCCLGFYSITRGGS